MPRERKQGGPSCHDDSDLGLPRGQFVGLWNVASYSDVCIRLMSAAPTEQTDLPLPCGQASIAGKVYKEIHAHKIVLEAGSTYFKGLLTTGQDIAAKPAKDDVERENRHSEGRHAKARQMEDQIVDMSCNSEEEAVAIESVLQFLYTHDLPASPSISMLSKMIITADYLGADLCVKACAIGLSKSSINEQSAPLLYDVLDIIRRCSACNSAVIGLLQDALSEYVLAKYGNVREVVTGDGLLTSFCSQPLDAVAAWGRSDDLKTDSENSVVVVLNRWWQAQQKAVQTEDCKKQLSALVRPAQLSNGYLLYVLDKLDWFIAPFQSYKYVYSAYILGDYYDFNRHAKPVSKVNMTHRAGYHSGRLELKWSIAVNQIQEAASCTQGGYIQGPSGYCQGHTWSLFLEVLPADGSDGDSDDDSNDDEDCSDDDSSVGDDGVQENGIRLRLGIRKGMPCGLPEETPATADIEINGYLFELIWSNYVFEGNQARCKSVFLKTSDVATELTDYAYNNELMIVTKIDYWG